MRRLLIYCDGGFGNRFNALVSGLVLARKLDLSPQIVWPVNNWCGASFGELFTDEMPVVERELATFVAERGSYQYLIVEDRLGIADHWVTPLGMPDWDAVRGLLDTSARDIFYYTALIPPFIGAEDIRAQVRSLHLRDEIVQRAQSFLDQHGLGAVPGDLLGVQIRKTDFGRNGADDDQLHDLITRCPHKRFFVCSDDKAVEARFAALANVVVHAKTAHVEMLVEGSWTTPTADHSGRVYPCNVNRSAQSVVDAVVDLLILARSQIVKTSNSTFLNTALLLQQSAAA